MKTKINISIDSELLVDIDKLVETEERPSRSNAIEVLVRRGFKLPLATPVCNSIVTPANKKE